MEKRLKFNELINLMLPFGVLGFTDGYLTDYIRINDYADIALLLNIVIFLLFYIKVKDSIEGAIFPCLFFIFCFMGGIGLSTM